MIPLIKKWVNATMPPCPIKATTPQHAVGNYTLPAKALLGFGVKGTVSLSDPSGKVLASASLSVKVTNPKAAAEADERFLRL